MPIYMKVKERKDPQRKSWYNETLFTDQHQRIFGRALENCIQACMNDYKSHLTTCLHNKTRCARILYWIYVYSREVSLADMLALLCFRFASWTFVRIVETCLFIKNIHFISSLYRLEVKIINFHANEWRLLWGFAWFLFCCFSIRLTHPAVTKAEQKLLFSFCCFCCTLIRRPCEQKEVISWSRWRCLSYYYSDIGLFSRVKPWRNHECVKTWRS